jgi:gas vesicle protein
VIFMNDHDTRRYSPLSSMLYFLAGGVAGAGVALLLAPQSGRATRELVRRKANETAGSARELKDELVRRGERIRDAARHRVDDAVSALGGDGGAKLSG